MNINMLPTNELMRLLVDHTPVAYIILDEDFRIHYINESFLKLRHLSKEQTLNDQCFNLSNGGKRCPICAVHNAIHTGRKQMLTRKDVLPDGTVRYIDDYAIPMSRDGKRYIFEIMVNRTKEMSMREQRDNDFMEIVITLSSLLEAKDRYTATHSSSVRRYARRTAQAMGLSTNVIFDIDIAASLHDIGKVGIPLGIINKPGKLTQEEFEVIKRHPINSIDMIKSLYGFDQVKEIVAHHHERYDGRGYPSGIAGEAIPMGARIVAVADTYDAMTSTRSYRQALTHEAAVAELGRCSGTQFDPAVVEAFLHALGAGQDADAEPVKGMSTLVERRIAPLSEQRSLQAEEKLIGELVDEDEFVNSIIRNTPALYAILSHDLKIQYTSPSFRAFFGYTPEQLRGKTCYQVGHDGEPCRGCAIARAFDQKMPQTDLHLEKQASGGTRYLDSYAIPYPDVDPKFVIQVMFDRTEEVLLEKQHEEGFYRLIEVLTDTLRYQSADLADLSRRTASTARALAQRIGLPEREVGDIGYAANLCDIGLISLGTNDEDRGEELYRQHPDTSCGILKRMASFENVREIVRYHHERHDGGGFPSGLSGGNIPIGSRIIAAAEAYSQRLQAGMTPSEAAHAVQEENDGAFSPDIAALLGP